MELLSSEKKKIGDLISLLAAKEEEEAQRVLVTAQQREYSAMTIAHLESIISELSNKLQLQSQRSQNDAIMNDSNNTVEQGLASSAEIPSKEDFNGSSGVESMDVADVTVHETVDNCHINSQKSQSLELPTEALPGVLCAVPTSVDLVTSHQREETLYDEPGELAKGSLTASFMTSFNASSSSLNSPASTTISKTTSEGSDETDHYVQYDLKQQLERQRELIEALNLQLEEQTTNHASAIEKILSAKSSYLLARRMSLLRLVEDTQTSLRGLTQSSFEEVIEAADDYNIAGVDIGIDGVEDDDVETDYFSEPICVQRSQSQDELNGIPIVDLSELKIYDKNHNSLQEMCDRAKTQIMEMETAKTNTNVQLEETKKELLRTILQRDYLQLELKKIKQASIETEAETFNLLQERELQLELVTAEMMALQEEVDSTKSQLMDTQEVAGLAAADMESALFAYKEKYVREMTSLSEENAKLNQKVDRLTELVCCVVEEINGDGFLGEKLPLGTIECN